MISSFAAVLACFLLQVALSVSYDHKHGSVDVPQVKFSEILFGLSPESQFVELTGTPGMSLNGYVMVIVDSNGEVVNKLTLSGQSLSQSEGLFLVQRTNGVLLPKPLQDTSVVVSKLQIPANETHTYLLIKNSAGLVIPACVDKNRDGKLDFAYDVEHSIGMNMGSGNIYSSHFRVSAPAAMGYHDQLGLGEVVFLKMIAESSMGPFHVSEAMFSSGEFVQPKLASRIVVRPGSPCNVQNATYIYLGCYKYAKGSVVVMPWRNNNLNYSVAGSNTEDCANECSTGGDLRFGVFGSVCVCLANNVALRDPVPQSFCQASKRSVTDFSYILAYTIPIADKVYSTCPKGGENPCNGVCYNKATHKCCYHLNIAEKYVDCSKA